VARILTLRFTRTLSWHKKTQINTATFLLFSRIRSKTFFPPILIYSSRLLSASIALLSPRTPKTPPEFRLVYNLLNTPARDAVPQVNCFY